MKIKITTPIKRNYREVFALFNLQLFEALKPPVVNLKVERFDGCKKGDEVHLKEILGVVFHEIKFDEFYTVENDG